jgi:hypothetical protein
MSTTPRYVRQRIRNRIIEYLELASSFDEQAEYQSAAPNIHVPSEVLNQWADWVSGDWREYIAAPVFTSDEIEAVARFHDVWSGVCDATPDDLPDLQDLVGTMPWRQLAAAASSALAAFHPNGRSPEDEA